MKIILMAVAFLQLPNPAITPGAVRTTDATDICAPSFRTKPFRHTTAAMKHQACAAYGVENCPHAGTMEIDHLLPLELGGLDDVRNLWPQLARYPNAPGFHVKDKLENELHRRVCGQQMSLHDAQTCILSNWIDCYTKVFGAKP
jgi:hypothetical protein